MCFGTGRRLALLCLLTLADICVSAQKAKTETKSGVEVSYRNGNRVFVAGEDKNTTYQAPEITGLNPTDDLELAAPTIGLFVGVSQYGENSGMLSTAAHTLGAAMMHEAFFDAARQSEERARATRLRIPEAAIWPRHSQPVTALAFSPDGVWLASGAEDGSIVVARSDGSGEPVKLDAGSEVDSLTFSPDGKVLAAAAEKGGVLVWPTGTWGRPGALPLPGRAWGVAFSPDGSRMLARFAPAAEPQSEEVWVWTEGSGGPMKIALGPKCHAAQHPTFSPRGDVLATASCDSVRLWPAGATRPSHSLPARSPLSLSFTPDGSRLLVADFQGTRLWSCATGQVTDVPFMSPELAAIYAPHAILSPDGARIVAWSRFSGSIDIRKVDTLELEMTLAYPFDHPASLEFSRDSQHLLIRKGDNSAFLQELSPRKAPYAIPMPLESSSGWPSDLALPGGKTYKSVSQAVFSPDSSWIAAGYGNGQVSIVPGVDSEWKCTARDDRLAVLTDLDIPLDQPESKLLDGMLHRLQGLGEITRFCSAPLLYPVRPNVDHVGQPARVTGSRILESVDNTVKAARSLLKTRGSVTLVIYVAAHGKIGPDGTSYFLPADADVKNPATWIPYSRLVEPVEQFVSSLDHSERNHTGAVVIFDTCQLAPDGLQPSQYRPLKPRPGVVILESTSPGQYAWHWTLLSTVKEEPLRDNNTAPASAQPIPAGLSKETDFRTRISVLPIVSQYLFSELIKRRMSSGQSWDRAIMISTWVSNIASLVEELQSQIPDAKLAGQRQAVRIVAEEDQRDFPLFMVRARKW